MDASNTIVAFSSAYNFTTADADQNLPGADAVWHSVSGTSALLPAGIYTYRFFFDDYGNFDNAFLCVAPGCVLPVQFSYFNTYAGVNCQPVAEWKTTQGLNVKNFELQASSNAADFNTIATVNASGNERGGLYTINKSKLPGNITYYRLKITDNNGSYKFSDVTRLKNNCEEKNISVYPNPATEKIFVTVYNNQPDTVLIVHIATGQKVKQLSVKNGVTQVNINDLAAGVYYISEVNGPQVKAVKFIKY